MVQIGIIGFITVFVVGTAIGWLAKVLVNRNLDKLQNELETYKKEHGDYPDKISDLLKTYNLDKMNITYTKIKNGYTFELILSPQIKYERSNPQNGTK